MFLGSAHAFNWPFYFRVCVHGGFSTKVAEQFLASKLMSVQRLLFVCFFAFVRKPSLFVIFYKQKRGKHQNGKWRSMRGDTLASLCNSPFFSLFVLCFCVCPSHSPASTRFSLFFLTLREGGREGGGSMKMCMPHEPWLYWPFDWSIDL